MSEEKKNKLISSFVTAVFMSVVFLIIFFCGLKYQVPPPLAKKVILVELESFSSGGGGGGGGNQAHTQAASKGGATEQLLTQDIEDAPELPSSPKPKNTNTPHVVSPTPDPAAIYRPGTGGGSGGGSGTGMGSGIGSGIGPGEGGGSGGGSGGGTGSGIGYGKGNRSHNIPDVTITENGVVYVEVHVTADGTVLSARILMNKNYPTNITNSKIWEDCLARAKKAKFKPGKEELRVIMFK